MNRRTLRMFCIALATMMAVALARPASADDAPSANAGAHASNQFAFDLYHQLDQGNQGKNLFFSPVSISMALSMTAAGARGTTLEEMVKALHLGDDVAASQAADHALLEKWASGGDKRPYQLLVANRLWGQDGYPILPEFLDVTSKQYNAEMTLLDFAHSEASRQTINDWVAAQTRDKIKNLLPAGSIDADTRLVLTNAIYFKGAWTDPFNRDRTKDEDFTTAGDQKVSVALMHRKGHMGYAEDDAMQVLRMPYRGEDLSMIVLLPKATGGLPNLEKQLTAESFEGLFDKLERRQVDVSFPSFKMETSYELTTTLEALGIKQAFDRSKADFSGMSSRRELSISGVFHKAFVAVDEEGTEAAAATGTIMRAGAAFREQPPVVFRADHPFLLAIVDNHSRDILFLGRLNEPAAAQK